MPDENHFARIHALGYGRLTPIIPPDAPISERSSLAKRLKAGRDDRGKTPGVKWPDGSWSGFDFVHHESTVDDLDRWHAMGAGVGIKTGRGLVLIDADTVDEDLARIIKDEIERLIGQLPVRIGRYPKAGYLVRTDEDFRYARITFGDERVEILAEGRQFVAHGIHPGTKKPYRWPRGLPPASEVPFASTQTLHGLLDALTGLLPAATEMQREGAAADVDQNTLRGDWELIEKAVKATPNDGAFPTREAWLQFGYAIKAAAGPERERDALHLFQDWSETWTEGENDPDYVAAEFGRCKPPFKVGISYLCEKAEHASGGSFNGHVERWFEPVKPGEETPLFPHERQKHFKLDATPYRFIDPQTIPRREWLYNNHFIRKFVSATVAPSGVGKSSLSIVEALAMCSGKPLLGAEPKGRFRVWLWNGEDPRDELERRIGAAMMHYQLTPDDIGDRLFVDTGREQEIILATDTRDGANIAQPVASAIAGTIRANAIDAVIVDPFVSTHRVSENDNGAIDLVTKQWAKIADATSAAVELVHHVRKLNGGEVTVEDSRGAVALLATARSKRALAGMTKAESVRLGVEGSRLRFFRVGDARNNLALPASDDTWWYELRSVAVGNGAGGTAVEREMSGDQVGVVSLYRMESACHGVGPDDAPGARALVEAGEWRRDVRAGDAWIGVPIAQALQLDMEDPADKARVRQIVGEWIKAGTLKEVSRRDEGRKQRTYVEWNAADNLSGESANNAFG